jgi:hypothetical protein
LRRASPVGIPAARYGATLGDVADFGHRVIMLS